MSRNAPNSPEPNVLLEVIVSTLEDALEAEQGGAGRLEIVSQLELGGLTPKLETIQEICRHVTVPVRVMLRSGQSHTPSPREVEWLSEQAERLAGLDVEGLVLGFLRDGAVDLELTRQLLRRAPNLNATFHRAFDETTHPVAEIARLKELRQVNRILTSGGSGTWELRAKRLEGYREAAAPEITVLVGGGVNRMGIERLRESTHLREFHAGRAVRIPEQAFGRVQAEKVKHLVDCLNRESEC
jgi:copper homeostasis protein